MKRDPELMRKVLLQLEEIGGDLGRELPALEGYDAQSIAAQCEHLVDGGYLDTRAWYLPTLNAKGRELLVAMRNESACRRVAEKLKSEDIDPPFEILHELLLADLRISLGLGRGLADAAEAVRRQLEREAAQEGTVDEGNDKPPF